MLAQPHPPPPPPRPVNCCALLHPQEAVYDINQVITYDSV